MLQKEKVRKIRKRLGLTQRALADKLGVTVTTVARWEMGVRWPNAKNAAELQNLAKAAKGAA